ncbi:MAG: pantoate--beta-alanine ligase, partial [Deltaproteobacteria bacterium]|nr:pantoate--beta-alanine ligase [Deltaproteobacteria bacterium]
MRVISTIKEMCSISDGVRRAGQTIVLVPTMGYFHEGHLI